ncbi:NTF2-related export protein [Dirofilaria immitis]
MKKTTMSKLAVEDETACIAAKKFTDLFYDAVDRKRNKMNFLYADGAILVWNGNAIRGVEVIAKFYDSLPNSTHTLESLDCQYIDSSDQARPLVVLAVGKVVLGQMTHAFTQTLVLTLEDEKYKILSDRFRFVD